MADFSCPCCRKSLRKFGAISRLVPWWKPLPQHSEYKAGFFRCNSCGSIAERVRWNKGIYFRLASIIAFAGIGFAAIYNKYQIIPYTYWSGLGIGVGVLPEIFEEMFSRRPAYILKDEISPKI